MTRLPEPEDATATSNPELETAIFLQPLSAALVRLTQVIPSDDVITRLPVPVLATAANRLKSIDQTTLDQSLSAALILVFQVCPGIALER